MPCKPYYLNFQLESLTHLLIKEFYITMPLNPGPYTYIILGAGRQGTAAAYDLATNGDAAQIILADASLETARAAARRVNQLVGWEAASAHELEVTDSASLHALLEKGNAALSAVPYYYNLEITRAAISTSTHLTDLGGNTGVVWQQLDLNDDAQQAGVSVVPDCGMGPGLINTMGAYVIELLDEPHEVCIYDAGLPQNPLPPWNYQLTFHVNGLTNEMDGEAVFLRDGEIVNIPTLTEPEFIEFPGLGKLEADVTSGGTSTAPWTFQDKLLRYENKVLRYPGHYEWLRAYKTLGLFSETPVTVAGQRIIPREVYHALLEPKISAPDARDVAIIRARGSGLKDGRHSVVSVDLMDYFDPQTGFSAMERLTGWHCSIMMTFQAHGQIPPGVTPLEIAVQPQRYLDEFEGRGITHQVTWDQAPGLAT
jgi:lysine 6-dehydrogenase